MVWIVGVGCAVFADLLLCVEGKPASSGESEGVGAELLKGLKSNGLHGGVRLSGDGVKRLVELLAIGNGEEGVVDGDKVRSDLCFFGLVGGVSAIDAVDGDGVTTCRAIGDGNAE